MKTKRGQVTIFIILAILAVSLIALFFIFKDEIIKDRIPSEVSPIYNTLTSCLENDLSAGIGVLESQGGYIYLPDFESGSEYMPFSSQLNFVGTSVPYWYYISGNNIEREQVPSINKMETQLESFIEDRVNNCLFDNYLDQGFEISEGEPLAKVEITQDEVILDLEMDFTIKKDDVSIIKNHEISVKSSLGELYDSAKLIYEEEQNSLFLENYTLDILNLYAPVEGVDFSCSPKVWSVYDVFDDLQTAVEENLAVVKTEGDTDDYFVVKNLASEIPEDIYVDFLYSSNWPITFEVNPSEGAFLVADPVGDELGFGALGFCYVAYHFVYDFKYPVMVQLYNKKTAEIFQFPIAIVIEDSNPRKSLAGESSILEVPEICNNANTRFQIETLDSNSRNVNSEISFECFTQTCRIGSTDSGILNELFPQCVNGYIIASANGFKDAEVQVSTVNPGSLTIFMDRLYEMELSLRLGSSYYSGEALITFEDVNGISQKILYPTQNKINLSQGVYNISVSIYKNVSFEFNSTTQEYCTEVPRKIVGVLGFTKEECYEVEVPEQLITKALAGGGVSTYSLSESDLKNNERILINANEFPNPNSLVQIQENYILLENEKLEVNLI
jgi:hypothetical protein